MIAAALILLLLVFPLFQRITEIPGGISKMDLRSFLEHARDAFEMPVLDTFLNATPTAELEPITANYVQSDEVSSKL